ncbi:MAG: hypothetical protein Q9170_006038 [Blastenia crenularia]
MHVWGLTGYGRRIARGLAATVLYFAESSHSELQPRTAVSPLQSVLANEAPRIPYTPITSDHPVTPHSPQPSQYPASSTTLFLPNTNVSPLSLNEIAGQSTTNLSSRQPIYTAAPPNSRRRRRSSSLVPLQAEVSSEGQSSVNTVTEEEAYAGGATNRSRLIAETSPARKRPRLETRDMRYDPEQSSNNSHHVSNGSQHPLYQKSAVSNGTNGQNTTNGHTSPHRTGQNPSIARSSPRSFFGHDVEEVTRLLIQGLDDLGYHGAADKLSQESGFEVESSTVGQFREAVLQGDWEEAEVLLLGSEPPDGGGGVSIRNGDHRGLKLIDGADREEIRFHLKTQKYLELLENGDLGRALLVLRQELRPLEQDRRSELQHLSSMLGNTPDEVKTHARWDGATGRSRRLLLDELSTFIAPSVMIPQHRLAVLLDQLESGTHRQSGQETLKINHHQQPVTSAAWSPDSQSFVTGSLHGDYRLCLWSITGRSIHNWSLTYRVQDCAISPDGKRMVIISSENQIAVFDFETREELYCILVKSRMTCVNISRDSQHMLVNMADGEVHLIDIDTTEIVRRFTGQRQGEFVIRSTFGGADQNLIISGSEDSRIYIWHKENGTLIETLEGHQAPGCVNVVAWNPADPCMFASGGDDRKIRIWSKEDSDFHAKRRRRLESKSSGTPPSRSGNGRNTYEPSTGIL